MTHDEPHRGSWKPTSRRPSARPPPSSSPAPTHALALGNPMERRMSSEEPCLTVLARGCLFLRGVTLPYRSSLAAMAEEEEEERRGLRGAIIRPWPPPRRARLCSGSSKSRRGAEAATGDGSPASWRPGGELSRSLSLSLTPPPGLASARRSAAAAAAAAGQSPLLVPGPHVGPRPEPSNRRRAPSAWPQAGGFELSLPLPFLRRPGISEWIKAKRGGEGGEKRMLGGARALLPASLPAEGPRPLA